MRNILLASIFALLLIGCGGGGGSSYTPPASYTPPPLIEINEQNVDAAVVTSLESMGIRAIGDIVLPASDSSVGKSTSVVTKYAKTVSTALPSYAVESTDLIPQDCPFDGNYTVSDDNITYTFYECGVEENVTLDGTVKLTQIDDDLTLEFINLEVIFENDGIRTYFTSTIISENLSTGEYSATISGYVEEIGGNNRVDYERYTVTKTNVTADRADYTFDGYIKTECLGGWIQIKTIQAIPIPNDDTCPTQGEIAVIGSNSEVNVKINSNTSITIDLNGGAYTDTYPSCNDLPAVCLLQPI